jgi:hypothetical protein
MKPNTISKYFVGLAIFFGTLALSIPAEAVCRPTGRRIGGVMELRCTGGGSCCRPTGRFKKVGGKRYRIMNCSRCRR